MVRKETAKPCSEHCEGIRWMSQGFTFTMTFDWIAIPVYRTACLLAGEHFVMQESSLYWIMIMTM